MGGEVLSTKGQFDAQWNTVSADSNSERAHSTNKQLTDYLMFLGERRIQSNILDSGEFTEVVTTDNYAVEMFKLRAKTFRELGDGEGYFTFPNWQRNEWQTVAENWGQNPYYMPGETVDGIKGLHKTFELSVSS